MIVCADMVPSRVGAGLGDIAEALSYVEFRTPSSPTLTRRLT